MTLNCMGLALLMSRLAASMQTSRPFVERTVCNYIWYTSQGPYWDSANPANFRWGTWTSTYPKFLWFWLANWGFCARENWFIPNRSMDSFLFHRCLQIRNWFKGQDTLSLLTFLESRFETAVEEVEPTVVPFFQDILKTIKSANVFMKCLYHTALWLTSQERTTLLESGRQCIEGFEKCANRAFALDMTRFKFQPKIHMWAELLFTLEKEKLDGVASLSPLAFATQVDEDMVGKVSAMSRMVNIRTVHSRTLNKYQVALASRW